MATPPRREIENKEDPGGILYLSNKYLILEQKEKVATKKVFFLPLATELVLQTLIHQPLSSVKSIIADSKGLFGHHDYIEVQFSDGKLDSVSFHHSRACDYSKDRMLLLDNDVMNVPLMLPNSNHFAALKAPILQGQVETECEYCSVAIRI
jgi:hypothetical protein